MELASAAHGITDHQVSRDLVHLDVRKVDNVTIVCLVLAEQHGAILLITISKAARALMRLRITLVTEAASCSILSTIWRE